MMKIYLFAAILSLTAHSLFSQSTQRSGYYLVADFDDLYLEPGSYWNGSDGSGGFRSGPVKLMNEYNASWGSWSGFCYSNMADDTTPGYLNQYSAITTEGYDPAQSGGPNYTVSYVPADWATFEPLPVTISLKDAAARSVIGCYLTNSTQAALSMRFGDDYAKKFGGESGNDPDWFMLTIKGFRNDIETGSVDFYLADYRFVNNEEDYILDTWEWVDLSGLGQVDSLKWSLSSSDTGDFGMNTPAYFCMDNLTFDWDPFVSEVLEYVPAPGQLINSLPWGVPSAAQSIVGGSEGGLSLGAFGGYMVFRFDRPVENHPDNPYGIDFTIFGNASQIWSEPAAVWVMKDENGNGLPDDTWFELAGSDHYFTTSLNNYEVTYQNPGGTSAKDVPWSDNQGEEGFIFAIGGHDQAYYPSPDSFPMIGQDQHAYTGVKIEALIDSTQVVFIKSRRRAFGYADNQVRGEGPNTIPDNPYTDEIEHSGGDAFDLDWTVDATGNYVDLDRIHFVKVQTAVQADGGWLGELSAEITGAVDVEPDQSITGEDYKVVVRDLPVTLKNSTLALEAYVFRSGRLEPEETISWTTNMPEATVGQDNILTVTKSGELEVTATLDSKPSVYSKVTTIVDLSSSGVPEIDEASRIEFYPNPATSTINVKGIKRTSLTIWNSSGQVVLDDDHFRKDNIDISQLSDGIYFVRMVKNGIIHTGRFIKR